MGFFGEKRRTGRQQKQFLEFQKKGQEARRKSGWRLGLSEIPKQASDFGKETKKYVKDIRSTMKGKPPKRSASENLARRLGNAAPQAVGGAAVWSMHMDKSVDAKKFVKRYAPKGTELISSEKDLNKIKGSVLAGPTRDILRPVVKEINDGMNAAAFQFNKKYYVLAPRKAPVHALGHEVGHLKDFEKVGYPSILERATGKVSGAEHRREMRAWKESPIKKNEKYKEAPLESYRKGKVMARASAAGAVTALVVSSLMGSPKFAKALNKVLRKTKGINMRLRKKLRRQ